MQTCPSGRIWVAQSQHGNQTLIELSCLFPPTTNNLFMNVGKRRIPTQRYRTWRELAAVQIDHEMIGQTPVTGLYHMVLSLDRPDKRDRDLSNYIKAVEDVLVLCGVMRDDSDAVSLIIKWTDRTPGKGAQAFIEIEEAK